MLRAWFSRVRSSTSFHRFWRRYVSQSTACIDAAAGSSVSLTVGLERHMTKIRALTEADLSEAQRILRIAFGTFLGEPDPEQFWSDLDYVYGRFGAEHTAAFAAEDDEGALAGSNFATRWGSVGFFGPLTTLLDLWDGGIGQRLVFAACDQLDAWGVRHAGLFTFAQSAKHVGLYGKFGFHPRFLTAIMALSQHADHNERRRALLGIARSAAAASGKRLPRADRRTLSRP